MAAIQVDRHTLDESFSLTSLESLINGYVLNCKSEGKSPVTILGYQMVLRNFLWYVRENNFPEIHGLDVVHIRHFLWYLSNETHRWGNKTSNVKKPACQTTINGYYRALNSFFNWLVREQLVRENPLANLKKPRPEKKVVQALTRSEIERLFSVCTGRSVQDLRNKAILSVFLDRGLRVAELSNLKVKDVNLDDGSILVRHGKGNKQRIVRVGVKAQKALWKYLKFII